MALEAWQRGPVDGVPALLQPVAHALIQSREELRAASSGLSNEQLGARPGGAASIAFHLRHVVGAMDRLLTYARGEELTDAQREAARREATGDQDVETLLTGVETAIGMALTQVRATPESTLLEARTIGRARLPTNVLGLLFHVAEHTTRHTGQVIATEKAVRGG